MGAFVSVNLLFKVTIFRVENFDRTTPADTGIYTEEELVNALGIEKNSNLFGFSTAEKTAQLAQQFPYLEQVGVEIQLPATVVIKVEPAVERFACMYAGGWMVLSDSLKILRTEVSQPEGLILLSLTLPADFAPAVGQSIVPESYNSLLGGEQATAETAGLQASAAQTLTELRDGLLSNGLFDGATALDIRDLSDIQFTYQNRIQVRLGSEMNLAYKLRKERRTCNVLLPSLDNSDKSRIFTDSRLQYSKHSPKICLSSIFFAPEICSWNIFTISISCKIAYFFKSSICLLVSCLSLLEETRAYITAVFILFFD